MNSLNDSTIAVSYTFQFPLDLERVIFEQAAYRDRRTALQLITVAKHICHWVERFIYEYIPISNTSKFLLSLADSSVVKPVEFYVTHVKGINISLRNDDIPEGTLALIFTRFTNLQNIALWASWEDPQTVSQKEVDAWNAIGVSARPTRFSCCIQQFFGLGNLQNQPDFGSLFFSRLTHLDILDSISTWKLWNGLESLPCLTHLAISDIKEFLPNDRGVRLFIERMLKECLTLELILFSFPNLLKFPFPSQLLRPIPDELGDAGVTAEDVVSSAYKDPRCVVVDSSDIDCWDDWSAPFCGEVGLWNMAEQKVQEQRLAFKASNGAIESQ